MLILAIDPSINNLWVALLEDEKLLNAITVKTKSEGEARLTEIANIIKSITIKYKPDLLAIESQYVTRTQTNSILKTCEVKWICRGVFQSITNNKVVSVTPAEGKSIALASGTREISKIKTIKFVTEKYKLLNKIDDNAADAICIWLAAYRKMHKF